MSLGATNQIPQTGAMIISTALNEYTWVGPFDIRLKDTLRLTLDEGVPIKLCWSHPNVDFPWADNGSLAYDNSSEILYIKNNTGVWIKIGSSLNGTPAELQEQLDQTSRMVAQKILWMNEIVTEMQEHYYELQEAYENAMIDMVELRRELSSLRSRPKRRVLRKSQVEEHEARETDGEDRTEDNGRGSARAENRTGRRALRVRDSDGSPSRA